MGIIAALIIGGIAGWLAGLIVRGAGFGLIGNIVIGIIGALLASWLLPQLGVSLGGGWVRDIINATIGARDHPGDPVADQTLRKAHQLQSRPPDRRSFTVQAASGPRTRQQGKRIDEIYRHQGLCRHRRPQGRRQRLDRARAPAADQGRARHRQDRAGGGSRQGARRAAADLAHQVDHQGAAGPLRIRRGVAPARQPARRLPGSPTSPTTSSAANCGKPSPTTSARCC